MNKKYTIFFIFALQVFATHGALVFGLRTAGKRISFFVPRLRQSIVALVPTLKGQQGAFIQKRFHMEKTTLKRFRDFMLSDSMTDRDKIIATECSSHLLHLWEAAIDNGDVQLLNKLIEFSPSVLKINKNGPKFLYRAVEKKHTALVHALIKEGGVDPNEEDAQGRIPLVIAVSHSGNYAAEMVRILINEGADVNRVQKDGETSLIAAISNKEGSLECVRLLLDAGAEINKKGSNQRTALFRAARLSKDSKESDSIEERRKNERARNIFKELLTRGADLNIQDEHEKTVFHVLAMRDSSEAFQELKKYAKNVKINLQDDQDKTALHYAVARGDLAMVQILVEDFGANVNVVAYWRLTPLMIARQSHHDVIALYLLNHGAKQKFDFSKIGMTEQRLVLTTLVVAAGVIIKIFSLCLN